MSIETPKNDLELPKVGDPITVMKRSLQEGTSSEIQAGEAIEGMLMKEIQVGEKLFFGTGTTSPIQDMRVEGDKIIIKTQTSEYEIEWQKG